MAEFGVLIGLIPVSAKENNSFTAKDATPPKERKASPRYGFFLPPHPLEVLPETDYRGRLPFSPNPEDTMLKLYGSVRSRGSRVLWMLAELDIPYDHKDYLPRSPETKTPEFLVLNPNARVPVIDDDGFILSESMAINCYLAKKHKSPLYPSDPRHEALALQWSLWETDRLDRQVVNYHRHSADLPPAERKPELAKAALEEVEPAMEVLETALKKSDWLAGPAFSVADLNVASALYRALFIDLKKWPRTQAWLTRCWARPAAKKVRAMREGK
jgi:glutathione S-transferase